jgi:transglutaminase-like putative cysteine protease
LSSIALGRGAVYTVVSRVEEASGPQLARSTGPGLPAALQQRYTQLPHPYARARALARSITAGDTSTYAKVQALIAWIGAHTHYSTDIPPLPPGDDTVDAFLFGDRVGFCEQISTALAVMLRSLDIPAREAVGYVPGAYNPITDLYVVEADDAHAWVQVWFPGYGWQSFDPTAVVPLANPDPGAVAVADVGRVLRHVPWAPVAGALAAVGVIVLAVRRYRRRPANWAARVARDIERAGRRAGHPRRPAETLGEYAASLDRMGGPAGSPFGSLAAAVEASAYGGREPSPADRRDLVAAARRTGLRRPSAPTSDEADG